MCLFCGSAAPLLVLLSAWSAELRVSPRSSVHEVAFPCELRPFTLKHMCATAHVIARVVAIRADSVKHRGRASIYRQKATLRVSKELKSAQRLRSHILVWALESAPGLKSRFQAGREYLVFLVKEDRGYRVLNQGFWQLRIEKDRVIGWPDSAGKERKAGTPWDEVEQAIAQELVRQRRSAG